MKGQNANGPTTFAHRTSPAEPFSAHDVRIPLGEVTLHGDLELPSGAKGLVVFAHGSGSSRRSPRNRFVAQVLRGAECGTLLFDLLTEEEEAIDAETGELRFDIEFLAARLIAVTRWLAGHPATRHLPIGYFGASTGGAAALMAAAALPDAITAVVSRGGRPDLARSALRNVRAATLLIVGGYDDVVIELNEQAYRQLTCPKEMRIIPGATHLFEEPGTLEAVAEAAAEWFQHAWPALTPKS